MRTTIICLVSITLTVISNTAKSQDVIDYPRALLFSPGVAMRSGAENVSSIQATIAKYEDQLLNYSWSSEKTFSGKLLGVTGRSLKFAFLDMPIDYFSMVVLHEWYGHGSRYRELNVRGVDYGYEWPPPYGGGGGWASYYSSPGEYSTQERLSIWIGGLESQQVLNRILR